MARLQPHDVRFFASAAELRAWLVEHHASATELWIGTRSKASGRPTFPWGDAVDELLCFGWIDSVMMGGRKRSVTWDATPVGRSTLAEEHLPVRARAAGPGPGQASPDRVSVETGHWQDPRHG